VTVNRSIKVPASSASASPTPRHAPEWPMLQWNRQRPDVGHYPKPAGKQGAENSQFGRITDGQASCQRPAPRTLWVSFKDIERRTKTPFFDASPDFGQVSAPCSSPLSASAGSKPAFSRPIADDFRLRQIFHVLGPNGGHERAGTAYHIAAFVL